MPQAVGTACGVQKMLWSELESGWRLIENRDGSPVDVTEYGNEISEGSYLHLATIAEDFNLDGHVDFYTVSRARKATPCGVMI